jgi:integrase
LLSRVSKTGIAQMFEIPAGLQWVLRAWRAHLGKPAASTLVVQKLKIERGKGGEAEALRADLLAAGVTRAVLFPEVDAKPVAGKATAAQNVEPLRFHDLRATFVTWAKRAGKGDGWISDRTGHLTPEMIDRYSRAARTLADLKMEPFP